MRLLQLRPQRVISGGQTGVDRAALDVAMRLGVPCGGWVPRGRLAEDGVLDARYPLRETQSRAYVERTRRNVRDSDGTLILVCGTTVTGGTALTLAHARSLARPVCRIDLTSPTARSPAAALSWIDANRISVLNVAGPRESSSPGIYQEASAFLEVLLAGVARTQ